MTRHYNNIIGGLSCFVYSFLFLYDLLAFQYQLAEASSIIRSYTHVGVTRHVSEACEAETCLARMCATLLQFLLTEDKGKLERQI